MSKSTQWLGNNNLYSDTKVYIHSSANEEIQVVQTFKKLLKKNILIRDCSTFCGLNENYIRIAVKNRNQNKLLIKALGEIKW